MACWPEAGQSQTLWTRAAVPQSVPSLHVEAVRIDAVVLFSLLMLPYPFPPCGNVFVVVVVYFILFVFLTLSNVLSYAALCVTCGQARSA